MAASNTRLTYFNGKGRAEPIRVLLAELGIDYHDNRVDDISSVKDKCAFGQVPLLEIDGHNFVQSIATCRYLARKHGLYGKSDYEGYLADMIVDGVQDLNGARNNAKTDDQKATFQKETLPKWLNYLEKQLKDNGPEYFVGNSFTYADVIVYLSSAFLVNTYAGCLDSYPLLKAHHDRVAARPKIAEWIKKRPQTAW
eukprot:TRINITY_DN2352_c0_g1_i1.p1 TRINITY_DN2352_c0_g1~~TRINITY_DN2352_c0_g1_i1.p1  ORF type:complete len:197 (+),score=77.92 TRINITY_DN2352_c0_g1_i1:69-659(+)